MKYILEIYFNGEANCEDCKLYRSNGLDWNGETVKGCYGLGPIPRCPEEGRRSNCPLKPSE